MCFLIHLWPTPTPTTLSFFQTLFKTTLETLSQATHYSYGHEFPDYGVEHLEMKEPLYFPMHLYQPTFRKNRPTANLSRNCNPGQNVWDNQAKLGRSRKL